MCKQQRLKLESQGKKKKQKKSSESWGKAWHCLQHSIAKPPTFTSSAVFFKINKNPEPLDKILILNAFYQENT